ncbi:hypothetical protein ACIBHX_02015 [Nonomuraea sp. NPDC050536]|uniref:hypothetical protein n=1 Tax=Nonomuraea sp. NPDC050536 TaxID=3364366 RepID=UPI0037C9AD35
MTVVATADFTTYLGMVCFSFKQGQEIDGALADQLVAQDAPVRPLTAASDPGTGSEPEQTDPEGEQGEVLNIEGTAKQVLAWVGDDPERARQAAEAEAARGKPRSTLLARLDEIINT